MAEIVKRQSNFSRPTAAHSVIESEVFDASRKARGIVENAQVEANGIVQKAKAESAAIRQQAKEEGFEKGFSEGLEKFQANILDTNEKYAALANSAESELLGLCMGIAHKILKQELRTHPDAIVAVVREAIAPMSRKKMLTIRVNPEDRAILQNHRADLMDSLMGSGQIQFVADADIGQGGCLVETEHGIVDARLETEMNILSRLITGRDFHFENTVESEVSDAYSAPASVYAEPQEIYHEEEREEGGVEADLMPQAEEAYSASDMPAEGANEEDGEFLPESSPQTDVQTHDSNPTEDAEYSNLMSSIDEYLKSCDEDDNQ